MAHIVPFRAFRYDPRRVNPAHCVTQPYDKITPDMQESYYRADPHNLVRIILGKREPDAPDNNVYTRAAAYFRDWRREGTLVQDPEPSIYVYSQRFRVPGESTELERSGFIALGRIEDYSGNVVFRHEQTLAKPKADRLELLRATRAHFGQIFMLYDDSGEIDSLLSPGGPPDTEVQDEHEVEHRMWRVSDPQVIAMLRGKMADKKLIIADGHHRYETALTYRNERRVSGSGSTPGPGARTEIANAAKTAELQEAPHELVMMTFINMNSRGLVVLPTHRVVHGLSSFSVTEFVRKASNYFKVEEVDVSVNAARATALLNQAGRGGTAILAVTSEGCFLLHSPRGQRSFFAGLSPRQESLDVVQLHKVLLESVLALSEESIRNQENISYLRDAGEAIERVRTGGANVAFLMNPVRMTQVRDIAFSGEVLPQKSTDFFPKLLSGLTIYALE